LLERIRDTLRAPDAAAHNPARAVRRALIQAKQARLAEDCEQAAAMIRTAQELSAQVSDALLAIEVAIAETAMLETCAHTEEALATLESLIGADPESKRPALADARIRCAALLLAQGNPDQASPLLEKAHSIALASQRIVLQERANGYLAEVALMQGNAAYATHLLKQAIARLAEAGDLESLPHLNGTMGNALVASDQMPLALHYFATAVSRARQIGDRRAVREWARHAADLMYEQHALESALRYYTLATENPPPHEGSGAYLEALAGKARCELGLGQAPAARATLGMLAQRIGDDRGVHPVAAILAEAHLALADDHPARSLEVLAGLAQTPEAGADAPQVRDADRLRASALTALGQPDAALQALAQAAANSAGTHQIAILAEQGHLHQALGDIPAALAKWQDALARCGERHREAAALLLASTCRAQQALGNPTRADQAINDALTRINTIDVPQVRCRIYASAAEVLFDRSDLDTVEDYHQQAIALAQGSEDPRLLAWQQMYYASFLVATGDPKPAEVLLRDVVNSGWDGRDGCLGLATLALKAQLQAIRGDQSAAQRLYTEALAQADRAPFVPRARMASLHTLAARNAIALGQADEAERLAGDAWSIAAGTSLARERLLAGLVLAWLAGIRPQHLPHRERLGEAIALARRAGWRRHLALLLHTAAQIAPDPDQSERLRTEAMALIRERRIPTYDLFNVPARKKPPA
jgi:hypothetical protein